ncbi:hypothetical protein E2F50_05840 [Rhizobium deserti]|uniref:Uncharacterized protein n=1 Tax=Rhizobium deserti TaxID=2547961 RepID=A0A4R5UNY2_9HYPH|nr:hypothetical protein [Rhizobium deserti]TDK39625.1 hypothetical protein E2F50_05840 [Rhizobium deserti]
MSDDSTSNQEAARFGSSQPNIAKSSGTGEVPHKQGAEPTAADINKARKVWGADGTSDPSGRVADAGDGGGSHSMPYDVETASDVIGGQTKPE